jgi:hypothetical protein
VFSDKVAVWSCTFVVRSGRYFARRKGKIFQPAVIGLLSGPPDIVWPCLLGCKRGPVWDTNRQPSGLSSAPHWNWQNCFNRGRGGATSVSLLCHLQDLYYNTQNFVSQQNPTPAACQLQDTRKRNSSFLSSKILRVTETRGFVLYWFSHKVRDNKTVTCNSVGLRTYVRTFRFIREVVPVYYIKMTT